MRVECDKTYIELLSDAERVLTPEIVTQIQIDVPRTFSHCHPRFNEESHECLLQPLHRVLTAVTFCENSVRALGLTRLVRDLDWCGDASCGSTLTAPFP
jgi:hypothetical protein